MVSHALVTSKLQYCNTLCKGQSLVAVQKMQLMQNAATKVLSGVNYTDHITLVLKDLHWLPVVFWVQFKALVLTYKAQKSFRLE